MVLFGHSYSLAHEMTKAGIHLHTLSSFREIGIDRPATANSTRTLLVGLNNVCQRDDIGLVSFCSSYKFQCLW